MSVIRTTKIQFDLSSSPWYWADSEIYITLPNDLSPNYYITGGNDPYRQSGKLSEGFGAKILQPWLEGDPFGPTSGSAPTQTSAANIIHFKCYEAIATSSIWSGTPFQFTVIECLDSDSPDGFKRVGTVSGVMSSTAAYEYVMDVSSQGSSWNDINQVIVISDHESFGYQANSGALRVSFREHGPVSAYEEGGIQYVKRRRQNFTTNARATSFYPIIEFGSNFTVIKAYKSTPWTQGKLWVPDIEGADINQWMELPFDTSGTYNRDNIYIVSMHGTNVGATADDNERYGRYNTMMIPGNPYSTSGDSASSFYAATYFMASAFGGDYGVQAVYHSALQVYRENPISDTLTIPHVWSSVPLALSSESGYGTSAIVGSRHDNTYAVGTGNDYQIYYTWQRITDSETQITYTNLAEAASGASSERGIAFEIADFGALSSAGGVGDGSGGEYSGAGASFSSVNYVTVLYSIAPTDNSFLTNLNVRKYLPPKMLSTDCSAEGSSFTLIPPPGAGLKVYWWGYTGSLGAQSLETSALSGSFKSNGNNLFQVSMNRGNVNPVRFSLPIVLEENQGLEFITSSIIGT